MQFLVPILIAFASSLVARMLMGAGLAFFTYNWIMGLVEDAQYEMVGLFNNIPSDLLGLLSILKIPQAFSVILSAIGIAAFVKASKVFLGRAGAN
jgi:hypothetical protein